MTKRKMTKVCHKKRAGRGFLTEKTHVVQEKTGVFGKNEKINRKCAGNCSRTCVVNCIFNRKCLERFVQKVYFIFQKLVLLCTQVTGDIQSCFLHSKQFGMSTGC